jgi:hypothetical protein
MHLIKWSADIDIDSASDAAPAWDRRRPAGAIFTSLSVSASAAASVAASEFSAVQPASAAPLRAASPPPA